ncbi:phytanoyl-CoA dioxygenase family protein [Litoribrevibacter albus]|uniref:Phytanoyl-CoA dioxygenase n=1 Tax=Litoribrevibacter albus TaxID=1473156 RepID=A0AA37S8S6_9GAMM|nr:phytanoyl-CoA dioxygenase family protein [Litoribrevibacter albus]GLQ30244.1 phytanoyl-CoA dioxygenase [Litoribrevibacter albus]
MMRIEPRSKDADIKPSLLPEHPVIQHSRPLIESSPDAGFAKPHIDALVQALAKITGISANDTLDTLGETLDSGIALSPVQAAKCLQDLMRTHSFMRGVARAIQDQLKEKEQVEILYAGTGPYGLLLLPVLACFKDHRIQATLIDIHNENIDAVKRVVATLELDQYIRSIELADASQWLPPGEQKFDIILSETMNWMLKNEPQVLIFSHLVKYLRDEQSTLIPQQVVLDACVYNARHETDYKQGLMEKTEATDLGLFGCLNRESATAIAAGNLTLLDGEIHIPSPLPVDHNHLKLRTEVQVYQDLWLRDGESSLSLPLCFDHRHFQPGDTLRLTYQYGTVNGSPPGYSVLFPERSKTVEEPVSSDELGALGIRHLKRLWHKAQLDKVGRLNREIRNNEWLLDRSLIDLLEVGLEECLCFLYQTAKDYDSFERWLLEKNGGKIEPHRINEINRYLSTDSTSEPSKTCRYLSEEQKSFWQQNGYLVVENVLDKAQCQASVEAIYRFLEKHPEQPDTWYKHHSAQQNIMVQLFRDPALDANRKSEKIRQVFADLWQSENLHSSTDRVGFNPPETPTHQFNGTRLHWDLNFSEPLVFGIQGMIYLTDVAENQGAFRCVPGFHHKLEQWLAGLPEGADPNQQDLSGLEARYVSAPAGSLVVWHQFLPHGGSPNNALHPRIVQYLTMYP